MEMPRLRDFGGDVEAYNTQMRAWEHTVFGAPRSQKVTMSRQDDHVRALSAWSEREGFGALVRTVVENVDSGELEMVFVPLMNTKPRGCVAPPLRFFE